MINIKRSPLPEMYLEPRIQNAIKILYLDYEKSNSLRSKFDVEILQLLRKDLHDSFNNRCAFCESKFEFDYPEVVHFRPVTGCRDLHNTYFPEHYWWLAYDWQNLYLSCSICAKFRRDLFPLEDESTRGQIRDNWQILQREKNLLLDPCVDKCEDFIAYDEEGVAICFGERGSVTIEAFGLNRPPLIEQRREAVAHFSQLLAAFEIYHDTELTKEMHGYVRDLFSDSPQQSFPSAQRHFFKLWLSKNESFRDILQLGDIFPAASDSTGAALTEQVFNVPEPELINLEQAAYSNDSATIEVFKNLQRHTIKSISITNLRSIRHLNMELLPSDVNQNRESWLLILGDNGIGKSSILQAIAIALGGEKEAVRLGLKPKDFLRHGTKKGRIVITSHETQDLITLTFSSRKFKWDTTESPTFLIAYGSTRLLPKGRIKPTRGSKKVNIDNLFDYSVALKDVNRWLRKVPKSEFDERIAPALADLLDLGADDKLCFSEGQLKIQDGSQEFKINQTSDGHKSIIALGCDIMQTLSDYNGSFHSMQGVVLIDELGNHLHPRWRMKIASSLRRAFPSLQFIVTTHEPLCLRGLSYGEVIVLHEITNPEKITEIEALDSKVLPDHNLLRVDQLLTSDLFGLINTLGDEKEKQYKEYYSLLASEREGLNQSDREKLEIYKEKLGSKELKGASAPVQALYEIVNESYARKIMVDGFKTQHELKSETINEVSDIIKNTKFDWL